MRLKIYVIPSYTLYQICLTGTVQDYQNKSHVIFGSKPKQLQWLSDVGKGRYFPTLSDVQWSGAQACCMLEISNNRACCPGCHAWA